MTEFGLIDQIKSLCAALPTNGYEGIGDDCAITPLSESESTLYTQDMLIERVHFLRDATSPYDLGRKSLAVNLSDIAAMGGRPTATLLSLAVPSELMGGWIEEFMRGYRDLSLEHGVALVGGDTTRSLGDLAINVTAIGRAHNSHIKRRSTAQVGDIIAVTGALGGSGEGLAEILAGRYHTPMAMLHKRPTPRVNEGQWLAQFAHVHSMMDLSDGVASDLLHILRASGVGAEVELNSIPAAGSLERALCSGEDYELLFSCDADSFDELSTLYSAQFGTTLHPIGRIVAEEGLRWRREGAVVEGDYRGFTHY
ncbi:MAG: thiamine-phosphate kinase [Rikenellaceae bacterium]